LIHGYREVNIDMGRESNMFIIKNKEIAIFGLYITRERCVDWASFGR
jgi:hypothetical protein